MAEQGIYIEDTEVDSGTGEIIATRTAKEPDDNGKNRSIQLVDIASRSPVLRYVRGAWDTAKLLMESNEEWLDDPDPSDTRWMFHGDIKSSEMMPIGDKTNVMAVVEFASYTAGLTKAAITPIFFYDCRLCSQRVVAMDAGAEDGYATKTASTGAIGSLISAGVNRMGHEGGTVYRSYSLFKNMQIPPGAHISSASFSLQDWVQTGKVQVSVSLADNVNPGAPATAEAVWNTPVLGGGTKIETDHMESAYPYDKNDLTAQMQYLVNHKDWRPGNSMLLIIDHIGPVDPMTNNYCTVLSAEDGPENAIVLRIRHGLNDWRSYMVPGETKIAEVGMPFGNSYGRYIAPALVWDAKGAKFVWFHYTSQPEGANNSIKILGGVF